MKNLNRLKLNRLKGAVDYCLLSYVDNFIGDMINSDSRGNDFWIWSWDDKLKVLTFAVRGTDDLGDVMKDISIYPKRLKGVGFCCAGFLSSAEEILSLTLSQFINAHQNDFKIVLTGHSYGGAVVQIMQQLLRVNHGIKSNCITFGSPRIWLPFAKTKGYHTRVQIETDPITYLPFLTGHVLRLYSHHQSEEVELEKEGWWMKPEDHYLATYQTIIGGLYAESQLC